jgi:dTMP kinase
MTYDEWRIAWGFDVRGVLITFEGVEGSGKTTQMARLGRSLRRSGHKVEVTREPDGTALGVAIRDLFERRGVRLQPLGEMFLFMAARQQHVAQVIRPALARGAVVVSDRYADATLAYQGFGGGMDLETIRDLNALATDGVMPDLTILLDLDPAEGIRRISDRRLDAFEKMDMAFHRRVREGYLEIARAEKHRIVVLSAAQPKDELHAAVAAKVEALLVRQEARHGA